ncbi:sulfotransferase [Novosphingobium sp. 9U]|uniref:tetratricopeptide repeat-containing sulfotransferase family protein n=1 Tax=Novosphingobium sp. 9U TaxID=2653158 RepID=UPI0013574D9A|nr:sulfotransferase [Novosphingobium sp. 9U]
MLTVDTKNLKALQVSAAASRQLCKLEQAERFERTLVESLRAVPAIAAANEALSSGEPTKAEQILSGHLARFPNDAVALGMLADVALLAGRAIDAEALLLRALACIPSYLLGRKKLARLLQRQNRWQEAIALVDAALPSCIWGPELLHLKSALLGQIGRNEEAALANAQCISLGPDRAVPWLSQARLLAQVGRKAEGCEAARKAIALKPDFGAAWWTLADLDPASLTDADISQMTAIGDRAAVNDDFVTPIHFALGRAWERRGDGARSFACYSRGHTLRRHRFPYDARAFSGSVSSYFKSVDTAFFGERDRLGLTSDAPIFIVGMHRSGSTLVEQILASHPDVEGLAELPLVEQIAHGLGARREHPLPPQVLATLGPERAQALGETYMAGVHPYRRSDRPRFTDKMPGNWRHLALIRLILPHARIIEVRRDPLDCCVSNFCRYYAHGQGHADALADLGRYYRDYVAFMDWCGEVLPQKVHRVRYERLVEDPEGEVRRLLDACALPFDPRCLRFFDTERPVRTPSAQQVRRPINNEGIGRAHLFAPWLAPLEEALGPLLPAPSSSVKRR